MEETQTAQRHQEQVRRVEGGIWDNGFGQSTDRVHYQSQIDTSPF